MPRRWRGVLVIEGEQTGDGRVIAEGALTWADLPLPLAWLRDGDQHISLTEVAPQVGIIETITRDGNMVIGEGVLDDEQPDGAELIRRLESGTAALGSRVGLSIDPDDWEVQIIATEGDAEDEMLILLASGTGPMTVRQPVRAAAGDPDPGDEGVVVYQDAADSYIERYTRMRIRGVTACAVAAFAGAYLELADSGEGEAADEDQDQGEEEATPEAVAASAAPVRPPAEWFTIPEPAVGDEGAVEVYGMPAQELLVDQGDGTVAVPLTILDDGRVFGHVARWGQCHVGYPDTCVSPPESTSSYAHFHVGEVVCEGGERIATGTLTVGCDHAAAHLRAPEARDFYAHSGLAFADVRASNGELGVWVSGVLRPDVDEAQLRALRASSLSGDWRRIGNSLDFIAALAVNVPGFPIVREALAAALRDMPTASLAASAYLDDGVQWTLLASGVVQRCPECGRRAAAGARNGHASGPELQEVLRLVQAVERRTRHLVPAAATHLLDRIR